MRYVSFFEGDDTNRRIGILYCKFLTTMVVVSEARYMNKLNVMHTLYQLETRTLGKQQEGNV